MAKIVALKPLAISNRVDSRPYELRVIHPTRCAFERRAPESAVNDSSSACRLAYIEGRTKSRGQFRVIGTDQGTVASILLRRACRGWPPGDRFESLPDRCFLPRCDVAAGGRRLDAETRDAEETRRRTGRVRLSLRRGVPWRARGKREKTESRPEDIGDSEIAVEAVPTGGRGRVDEFDERTHWAK